MASRAYVHLAHHLLALHRRDLLGPLASAYAAIIRLAILIARAEEERDLENSRRLKIESMKQRAEFERALAWTFEAVSDADGDMMVDELMMGGDGRTLAQVLLDEDDDD
jgi:hypothetical protein